MSEEISEIEKAIKEKIKDETQRSIEGIAAQADEAIHRINGVYASCLSTLEQLKLVDSDLFKFFWKTKGNVKVVEIEPRFGGSLSLQTPDGHISTNINISEKKKYRVVVIVTEVEGQK